MQGWLRVGRGCLASSPAQWLGWGVQGRCLLDVGMGGWCRGSLRLIWGLCSCWGALRRDRSSGGWGSWGGELGCAWGSRRGSLQSRGLGLQQLLLSR